MRRIEILVCAAALALTPGTLHAQAPRGAPGAPDGFWASAGAGAGWARVSCPVCRNERRLGASGYARAGGTPRPGLLVGGELNVWTRQRGGLRENAGALGVVAYLYPRLDSPLHLKAGAAVTRYTAGDDVSLDALGVQLGLGYEFRVAGAWWITNYANLIASSFGRLTLDGETARDDASLTLFQLGVALTRR